MALPSPEEGPIDSEAGDSAVVPDHSLPLSEAGTHTPETASNRAGTSHFPTDVVVDKEAEGGVECTGDKQRGIRRSRKISKAHKCSTKPSFHNSRPNPITDDKASEPNEATNRKAKPSKPNFSSDDITLDPFNPEQASINESTSHAPPASGIGKSLANHINNWRQLPKSSFACNIIKKGVRLPFTNKIKALRSLKRLGPHRYYTPYKRRILEEECERLLNLKVIEEIPSKSIFYANHIFFKLKPDGTIRLIFDMKCLNTVIKKPSFSMLKSKTLFPFLHINNWAGKLDLKDAYWHIPLHPSAQNFLTFKLGKRKFKWKVVPFGLKTAPYIFSKIMYTVIKYIRNEFNILVFNYLDDILILADTFQECKSHIQTVIKTLQSLGWQISLKKSIIKPAQNIEFLGIHYDLGRKTMRPMNKNIDKCIKMANFVSNSVKCDLKLYQRLIGSLNFSSFFTFSGKLHLKFLHRYHGYFSKGFKVIPPSFKRYLKVWEHASMYEEINIPNNETDSELFTDASNLGWGGALMEQGEILYTNNTWLNKESALHINVKELLACVFSIKHFSNKLKNKSVLIHIDSKVTYYWIKKQGSIKNKLAQEIIKDFLDILYQNNISIHTKWIKGKDNTLADTLSRNFNDFHPETSLSDELFHLICSDMSFSPEIDLFSNGFNSKCKRFCSSSPNENAISNNALNISWSCPSLLYAFPPGFLLNKVAFKIYKECNNNMLFCTISQDSEPWIPLVRAASKIHKTYKVTIDDYQTAHKASTSHSAQSPLDLHAYKI